jgi:hypothetical protein
MLDVKSDKLVDIIKNLIADSGTAYTLITSFDYSSTLPGRADECWGCTLGDGQDCSPPKHFIDEYLVVTEPKNRELLVNIPPMSRKRLRRFSVLSLGYSIGGCSNGLSDPDPKLFDFKFDVDGYYYSVGEYIGKFGLSHR